MLARWTLVATLGVITGFGSAAWGCGGYGSPEHDIPDLVAKFEELTRIESPSQQQQEELQVLCEEIRCYGYEGLDSVLKLRDQLDTAPQPLSIDGDFVRQERNIDPWIDKIAGQKFAAHSRLFWHTSRADAQLAAEQTGRPVLSLRMLGHLDEDLSCANSRFFRTILYPHPEIQHLLREQFVLHWQPVREVPVVTVDFGNGQLLRQPLVGNSVHLMVSPQGKVFDAMPGLVTPTTFVEWLGDGIQLWEQIEGLGQEQRLEQLATWHRERAQQRRSESTLAVAADQAITDLNPLDPRWQDAASDMQVELPAVTQILVNQQQPQANAAMRMAPLKSFAEAPLLRMVQLIEPRLAIDDVFNRYALQTRFDDWYDADTSVFDYEAITQQIYEQLFLMPLDDPWLGLSSTSRFVGLERGGRIEAVSEPLAKSIRPAGKR